MGCKWADLPNEILEQIIEVLQSGANTSQKTSMGVGKQAMV